MNILIDNMSGAPIYDQIYAQIKSQIKSQIIRGVLGQDEALPSIRNLAKDLRVSVITTKRAYDELEREGLIYTAAGKGCFVAKSNPLLLREEHLKQIEAHLKAAAELAKTCELSRSELAEMMNVLYDRSRRRSCCR